MRQKNFISAFSFVTCLSFCFFFFGLDQPRSDQFLFKTTQSSYVKTAVRFLILLSFYFFLYFFSKMLVGRKNRLLFSKSCNLGNFWQTMISFFTHWPRTRGRRLSHEYEINFLSLEGRREGGYGVGTQVGCLIYHFSFVWCFISMIFPRWWLSENAKQM